MKDRRHFRAAAQRAQIRCYKKRSIRHPSSSNIDPNIFQCGVAMLFQTRNTSGVAQRKQHQGRTPVPLVEEIRAKGIEGCG
jgi:hypothetical protein